MTIEFLFPELCNLYGDMANITYLRHCLSDATFYETHNRETPRFLTEHVDLVYLGTMTERGQELALSRLMACRDELRKKIEDGMFVLATGNAGELFGKHIDDGGRILPALDYFPCYARRNMENRHNSMFIGTFDGMKIVGNKSQYSFSYGDFPDPFIRVTGGYGMNPDIRTEGIHYKNFYATYLLGPFLVLNPPFTKHLLSRMGHRAPLAHEAEAMEAYEYRVSALEKPGVRYLMHE